jgi:hypothetical protein
MMDGSKYPDRCRHFKKTNVGKFEPSGRFRWKECEREIRKLLFLKLRILQRYRASTKAGIKII